MMKEIVKNKIKGFIGKSTLAANIHIAKSFGISLREVELFRKYRLFNEEYYLDCYPDVADSGLEPFLHFALFGSNEDRNPNRCFSTQHFKQAVQHNDNNPLASFYKNQKEIGLERGESIEKIIEILANRGNRFVCEISNLEKSTIDSIVESGLFDFEYYINKYEEVRNSHLDPIVHYFCYGDYEGRSCSHNFNAYRHRDAASLASTELAIVHKIKQIALLAENNELASKKNSAPQKLSSGDGLTLNTSSNWCNVAPFSLSYMKGGLEYTQYTEVTLDIKDFLQLASGQQIVIPFIAPSNHIGDFTICCKLTKNVDDLLLQVNVKESITDQTDYETAQITIDSKNQTKFDLQIGNRWYVKGKRYYICITNISGNECDIGLSLIPFSDEYQYQVKSTFKGPNVTKAIPIAENFTNDLCILVPKQSELTSIQNSLSTLAGFEEAKLYCYEDIASGLIETLCQYKVVGVVEPDKLDKVHGVNELSELPHILNVNGTSTFYICGAENNQFSDLRTKALFNGFHFGLVLNGSTNEWISNLREQPIVSKYIKPLDLPRLADKDRLPKVAIVTVLYKKANMVSTFLEVVKRQTYPGPISVVLVDDCSPDNSSEILHGLLVDSGIDIPDNINIDVIVNEENSGNCFSRNAGMTKVDADIYTIVDCDCLLNSDFVAAHVREHMISPTDVVIGPLNLESNGEEPWGVMGRLEQDLAFVKQRMNMQDDIQLNGFVNCITRNFSIKKKWVEANGGFDLDFSYSAKKDSGFGWEDVEYGSRIYKSGAHIKYTFGAISLHQSHPTSVPEERQIIGSAKNYNLLFERHPDVKLAARRWSTDTANKILNWADSKGVEHPYLDKLRVNFSKESRQLESFLSTWRTNKKRLKILQYRWHVPHQYEIHKLPHDFTLVRNTGTGFTNAWSYEQREMRENVSFIDASQVNESDYDLAIMHFDENVLCSDLSNGVLGPDWGRSFKWFAKNLKNLPKVAICHGTPPFEGQYAANTKELFTFRPYEEERLRLVELLADVEVVCNSYQAQLEWGFKKSRVIWHGLDPQEIPPGSHHLDVVSHGVDFHRPHYRGAHMASRIISKLEANGISCTDHKHQGAKLLPISHPGFASASFRAWIDHVGSHKVYLNTTLRSPMPRSRTEAMMSGTVPVAYLSHDVNCYIRNGVNGFYSKDELELYDFTTFMCKNEKAFKKVSKQARLTAMDVFNHDRFLADWSDLIASTIGNEG